MQKHIFIALLSGVLGLSACVSNDNNTPSKSTLAVIGDSPYGTSPTDDSETKANPAFIESMNKDADVSMVLHVGDIHSGKQYCTEAYNLTIRDQWKAFKDPLIYTPGDNEWTDCHKKAEGGGAYNASTTQIDYVKDGSGNLVGYAGGDPVANLDLVRSYFYPNPGKDFSGSINVHTQAFEYDPAHVTDSSYVENVWLEKSNVMIVTVNIPGGSNNDTDPWYGAPTASPTQMQEVANRSAAALRWLDYAFTTAKSNGDQAVVIQLQADMWDLDGKPAAHIAQYKQFIDKIASNSQTFGKPVLLLNGDSHVYRSDNPLVDNANCMIESAATAAACSDDAYDNQPNGYNVPNFHRITVHGSTVPLEWLKLTIDRNANAANGATAFGPFSWQRMPQP